MKTTIQLLAIACLGLLAINCSKDVVRDPVAFEHTPDPVEVLVPTLTSIGPTSGPKTTVVTINGNNFGTDSSKIQVYFNEKDAAIQTLENTKIVTIVPAGAFTGDVRVVVDGTELVGPEFNYIVTDAVVTTVAGSTTGDEDGPAASAKFRTPAGIVLDSKGNLFIMDNGTQSIRKITPDGEVSTLAGSTAGYIDGTGTNAQFNYPNGLAIDKDDNLYVADSYNYMIRKVTPSGVVSTLAGSDYGEVDGTGTQAKFKWVLDVVVDSKNNVFVSDSDASKIRKITPEGVVSTFAGSVEGDADGTGTNAQFKFPQGLAIDKDDNIYVADGGNNRIRKITPSGVVTTIAGTVEGFADGAMETAKFNSPNDVTIDKDGVLYVLDYENQRVRKIALNGNVSTLAGQSTIGTTDGFGTEAKFNYPRGICITQDGTIYISDTANHRIRKITQD